jgi:hypothetical protein
MHDPRARHINHPPAEVAKPWVDPDDAHACPFFQGLARKGNIRQGRIAQTSRHFAHAETEQSRYKADMASTKAANALPKHGEIVAQAMRGAQGGLAAAALAVQTQHNYLA